ncbi:hypothetical protein, partial [Streptomyces sp. t39]|uniref:hypothetical protein n=1 Tax=Streptomyces sp. t39 TaxID=1828156 RepID=UPI0012CC8380
LLDLRPLDPDYAAGRADAYDDHHTHTLDQLINRGAHYIEHADIYRAYGYMDLVWELRRQHTVETDAAWHERQTQP